MEVATLARRPALWALGLYGLAMAALILSVEFEPAAPPPPPQGFAGLPVSGSVCFVRRAGFRDCFNKDAVDLRCRRHAVRFLGAGPYEAAVDLRGGYGESGFDQLVLWSEADNDAVFAVIVALTRRGWHYCYTGSEDWGDQAVFTRAGAPVRVSVDISYWGRRRLTVLPHWNRAGLDRPCTPDHDLVRFGMDVAKAAGQR